MIIKKYKKFLLIIFAVCMLPFCAYICKTWVVNHICNSISIVINEDGTSVHPFSRGHTLYVILPSFCENKPLSVEYLGKQIPFHRPGNSIRLNLGGLYLGECNVNISYTYIPTMYINTESGNMNRINKSIDKSYKEHGDILVINTDGKDNYSGLLKSISGHGNGTWGRTKLSMLKDRKRSYNIKLHNKGKILGLTSGKKYCLLSNVRDGSNVKNYIAYALGKMVGIPYSADYEFVSLYLNGHYNGLYLVTNKIQLGKSSIDIPKMDEYERPESLWEKGFKKPIDEKGGYEVGNCGAIKGGAVDIMDDDYSGGYLIDHCNHGFMLKESISGFISTNGMMIRIKEPKYATRAEVEYIRSFYDEMDAAVSSFSGFNPRTGKHYTEYLDLESFAKYYALQELLCNTDGGRGSFYMYKQPDSLGGKMYAGPLWDFDNSLSVSDEMMLLNSGFANHPCGYKGFLASLCHHKEFMEKVQSLYKTEIYPIVIEFAQGNSFKMINEMVFSETKNDNLRWKKTEENISAIQSILINRANYLFSEWVERSTNKYSVFISMGLNLSTSYYIQEYRLDKDSVYVPQPLEDDKMNKYEFVGWFSNNGQIKEITSVDDSIYIEGKWKKSLKPQLRLLKNRIRKII